MSGHSRLEGALRKAVSGEVRFDEGARTVYSTDASNYRQVPIGVILPQSVADIEVAVEICRLHGVPVLARGGGTSLNGQTVNVAVVIDCSKYLNRILHLDPALRIARVEPGVVCDSLRDAASEHGLTFGPDPATHSRCTLGGMIGNNSCGAHSVVAGKTVDNIERLKVLTYGGSTFWCGPTDAAQLERIIASPGEQGSIYRRLKALIDKHGDTVRASFPKIRRRVSGYNLDQLLPENGFNVARALVGTEGGCAITLEAETRLIPQPRERVLQILPFADIFAAGDAVPAVLAAAPLACEGLDISIIGGLRERGKRLDDIALLPAGNAWLLVEFGGETVEEATQKAASLEGTLLTDRALITRLWTIRETGASATALSLSGTDADPIVGWEDAAVDPLRLGDYLREFQALVDRMGYRTSLYGHFGEGCIHARINFRLRTADGLKQWRRFLQQAAELVVKYGGSLSGEHGDGQAKAEFLPIMFGTELMQAFRAFKEIWDPGNRLNPHKLIDPRPVDADLRMGPEYQPIPPVATAFAFESPVGNGFVRATEHCIGMGKCRSHAGGTMCPSFRATREEAFSTRGRSRLLNEMLRGEIITDGWKSEAVKAALDTCLSCKGCRSDCPTHTDMAAYKAEFLFHYHKTERRPLAGRLMAHIGRLAPFGSHWPAAANGLATAVRPILGVQREIPRLRKTFRSSFKANRNGERVVLFDDTFNNHFRPQTAAAAQKLLESLGCAVELPRSRLCCGRPYYEQGMLDHAKRALDELLNVLEPGIPVVVLEPGCLSIFRDELKQLFPRDPRAAKLRVFSLSEFVLTRQPIIDPIEEPVVFHVHCHQKALWGAASDAQLLRASGCDLRMPDTGCCGMAGSFGYRNFDLSRSIANLQVLPALRAAPDAIVVADGFSCREQIESLAGRRTTHIGELLASRIRRHEPSLPTS